MASLDSQGEVVPIELPNPQETQIWKGENKSALSRQHLICSFCSLLLPLFDMQGLDAMVYNSLFDIEEKAKTLKLF